MRVIELTPDTTGLIRWLRHVYQTDRTNAIRILRAGWESLDQHQARHILEGEIELAEALQANREKVTRG